MIARWPASGGEEYALSFDSGRPVRILVIPALFDEGHKLRRMTVEVMRRLHASGHDCFLPDCPGQNESLALLASQTLQGWQEAVEDAAAHFRASHVLTFRGGAMLAPALPGWRYAPQAGARQLQSMLRARIVSGREAGQSETTADLLERGQMEGLDLSGYAMGPAMIAALHGSPLPQNDRWSDIAHTDIGGTPPWLRAEPGYDPAQADALAAIVAMALA